MRSLSHSALLRSGLVAAACLLALASGATAMRTRSLHVRLTSFEVEPGTDRIPCEYLSLPNDTAMDVQRIDVRSRVHLHHILLYGYVGDDRDPQYLTHGVREGAACVGLGPPDMTQHTLGLLGAVRQGSYALPSGYAISLLPHQPVSAQIHVFNTARRARRAAVRLRIVAAEASSVRHHLEPLDITTPSLELPPHMKTTRVADFVAPFDIQVTMLSSHQHRLGTRVTVHPIVGGVDGGPVYENLRWSEPPLRWIDPPLRLRAGDRLRVRCEWNNTTDQTIHQGPSANDEMCNLNGYFHRDVELAADQRTGVGGTLQPVVE